MESKSMIDPSAASDADLLIAWKAGDRRAGRRLFDRHVGAVSRFFANKLAQEADDLVQLTFLSALQAADHFAGR